MAELDVWAAIRALKAQLDRLTSFEWPLYLPGTWTPTWTNLTVVGAPTYAGSYTRIGNRVWFEVQITSGGANTTASTANSTRIDNLPFTAGQNGICAALDIQNVVSYGLGGIPSGLTWAQTPTWAATNNNIVVSGSYEI